MKKGKKKRRRGGLRVGFCVVTWAEIPLRCVALSCGVVGGGASKGEVSGSVWFLLNPTAILSRARLVADGS